jgi:hypothetical protein
MDRLLALRQSQYARLLQIEEQELLREQQEAAIWMKYMYLLLEFTMKNCEEQDILFPNLDVYEQTMFLREVANALRSASGLPEAETIYEPLDAEIIIATLQRSQYAELMMELESDLEEVAKMLQDKYGEILQSVPVKKNYIIIIIILEMYRLTHSVTYYDYYYYN